MKISKKIEFGVLKNIRYGATWKKSKMAAIFKMAAIWYEYFSAYDFLTVCVLRKVDNPVQITEY